MSNANVAFLVVSNVWFAASFLVDNKLKRTTALIVGVLWGTVGFFL